ncbi:LuxR family two component transcriptional regulator [Novosphingobium sp. PhB165]|jgi:DNA-binding NarL/FixJ family response regulator|uniref:response regulator n=1 Tax=Novosphingobium sp. PhB165 TaxID=2485105 RepID=UPI0010537D2A|nr:response regulator transcription factor [Novosphingobium sp. PhB165]TCM15326.1 LuxR family two component transcriptional regulator [Novosphingobium sp. PhB165]
MITLVVCDDHPMILSGIQTLLGVDPELQVVATARDGETALRKIEEYQPDIALIDIYMPDLDGLDLLGRINRAGWPVRVVLLSAAISDAQVIEAIAAGAAGIVLKDIAPTTLVECLRKVARGGRWLPQHLVAAAINRRRAEEREVSPFESLTPREWEVTRLLAKGMANRDIAGELAISLGTVKIHLHSIYSKLGADNRTTVALMVARYADAHPAPDSPGELP